MACTKTYTKKGYNFKAIIEGKAENRVADIYSNDEYIGKLYCVHNYRGDRFVYWADTPHTTSDDGLFDAAKRLSRKVALAKKHAAWCWEDLQWKT